MRDGMLWVQIMTPAEYGNVKAQLKAREDGEWKKVEWSLVRRPHLHELEVVHGRLIAQNPKVHNLNSSQRWQGYLARS